MFISSLQPAVVVTMIVVIAVQYAIALFCLLKLAYLDISKREYVLWNLFILLIFFIGDLVFLLYYRKVKDTKKIPPYTPAADSGEKPAEAETTDAEAEKPEEPETTDNAQPTEQVEPAEPESDKEE